jgi:hypothetical protein
VLQSAFVRLGLLSIITILLGECAGATPASPAPTGTLPSAAASVAPSPAASVAPSVGPGASPDRQQAYERLLTMIPAEIAATCESISVTEEIEPGQLGEADCDLPSGGLADFASYKLFADAASMNGFFETQRMGHRNLGQSEGPGCGSGPGEGTWEHGRKDCFSFFDDAYVMWTYDDLLVVASAFNDSGDYAKLEEFWTTAGPVAP